MKPKSDAEKLARRLENEATQRQWLESEFSKTLESRVRELEKEIPDMLRRIRDLEAEMGTVK